MAKDQSKKPKQQQQQQERRRRRQNEEKKKKPVASRQQVSLEEPSMDEWVAALAAKAVSASSSGGQQAAEASSASIERRLEKKRRRNDRLLARARDQQVREAARMAKGAAALDAKPKRGSKRKRLSREWDCTGTVSSGDYAAEKSIVRKNGKNTGSTLPVRQWESSRTSSRSSSSVTLSRLSAAVLRTADGWDKVRRTKQYIDPTSEAKGKASKRNKYEQSNIQPGVGSYGGLGFARPSLYLHLLDPSFVPKFREEYAEHITGFFGKARSKVMKKQLDGDMLWRKLLEKKRGGPGGGTDKDWAEEKYHGKRIKDMAPDARVDALIRLGFL
mmetsp:Transcript_35690/g.78138  ORF Transcript_35690/g.78138 Transcript_35690/m.78138 type:complete len:330 (-) Transcript_35690:183-1172(-)